ncbi:MAG: hypothetical protein U1D25_06145 [Hydrogenophaga sp.]|uniref:hypothetical protein n=1 Tax=Hydrogenophaga sp. TaxID=1904254 RepID=UPI002ABA6A98|nr:hypothetical protein [Hydrogenophaga sp.]MDZ4187674.1 hypothetical protein [Hydrogenophaga sp.]
MHFTDFRQARAYSGEDPKADPVLTFFRGFHMKLTKVAFAIASTLAVMAGTAHAGQIDSSSATLAIEVIKADTQVVRAPSKSYNFSGDVDARTNEQRMQLQYTLSKGTWAIAPGQVFTAVDTLVPITVANPGMLQVSYTDAANVAQTTFPAGTVINAFVTANSKTLVFNITIPAANVAVNQLRTPTVTLNAPGTLGTNNTGINNLFTVAGATACVAPDQNLDINFKHFTNHSGNNTVQTVAAPDSEHVRAGSTNDARLLNFTQNLDFQFTPASSASRTDAAFLNQRLTGQNWAAPIVAPVVAVVAPVTRHYMGKVNLRQRGNGLDLNYTNTYGDSVAPFVAANPFIAADFDAADDIGNLDAGQIEMNKLSVSMTLTSAWPTGTVIRAVDVAGVAIGGIANVTTTAGQTVLTFEATTAAAAAALANGVYLFADFPGNALIPQTSSIPTVASITKDSVAGAPDRREQDNSCSGTLTGVGGGIKIDVRNYASFATFGATGPATTVRIINNSETQTADVYGQMIYADGTYGAWGKLVDLKPREAVNMSNQAVEALLVNAPAAVNPFGAGATNYAPKGGASVVGGTKANTGDRLRIVSNTGSTLRVQSYMVVGNSVIDTSNAQGVDFENSGSRVPVGALDAQPVSQDAINGLSK